MKKSLPKGGLVVRARALWVLLGLSAVVLFAPVGACSDDSGEEAIALARLSEGCLLNSDCAEGLVCAFRRCHVACKQSRDCEGGARCVGADRPVAVCQLPEEKNCKYNSDCPGGQLCAVDGECRDQCLTARDCLEEQTCAKGSCADIEELTNGELPASVEPGAGTPCIYNSDCPEPLACVAGQCRVECRANVDCFPTFECRACRCTPGFALNLGGAGGAVGALGCDQ